MQCMCQRFASPGAHVWGESRSKAGRASCCCGFVRPVSYTKWCEPTKETAMKIRVINPNTSASMTAKIGAAARAVAASSTLIEAVQPSFGAPSIEGHHDDVWAAAGVLEQVRAGEAEGVD